MLRKIFINPLRLIPTEGGYRFEGEAAMWRVLGEIGLPTNFTPPQVTDLRLQQEPGAAVSRAVERFAKQRVSRRGPRSLGDQE